MSQTEIRVLQLEKEVELLRSAVFGLVGRDEEGRYRPSFVKRVLSSASEKPRFEFRGTGSFLKHLEKLRE